MVMNVRVGAGGGSGGGGGGSGGGWANCIWLWPLLVVAGVTCVGWCRLVLAAGACCEDAATWLAGCRWVASG